MLWEVTRTWATTITTTIEADSAADAITAAKNNDRRAVGREEPTMVEARARRVESSRKPDD